MSYAPDRIHVAIACGGTGGHLYPGLAVGERLLERDVAVTLVVSPKEIDQQAVQGDSRFRILTVPAVGFSVLGTLPFLVRSWRAYRCARREFLAATPHVFLAMGGFTSAPPALAARRLGAWIAFHEANAYPGRANRWLAKWAHRGFVCFPEAIQELPVREVEVIGMPVRSGFQSVESGSCRVVLGLNPDRPVLLVMGGSQGARGVNDAFLRAAPRVLAAVPNLQILHLTGTLDEKRIREAYVKSGIKAVVRAFLTEMELALGAATAALARAGASSAAELAALRVPSLLIPYPHAADDHQTVNALALEHAGAARMIAESAATPERLAGELVPLLTNEKLRGRLQAGLAAWYRPDADVELADRLLRMAIHPSNADATTPAPSDSVGLPLQT